MSYRSTEKSDGRANRLVDENNTQSLQQHQHSETSSDQDSLDNDCTPYKSEYIDPLRYTSQQQEQGMTPSEVYDPEDPKPYVLSKNVAKHVVDPTMREFRVAKVENMLSWKSIFCWSLATIVLVGGSLAAVIVTVDWSVTADRDDAADITNSTMNGSP
ncbi:MAG: hypothetical protein SGBAC_007190 [Bacillariaceae sp.]